MTISQYKKLVKRKHREYKNKIFDKIHSLDPKLKGEFWKYLNELRKSKKENESEKITDEEWVTHFQSLLSEKNGDHNFERNIQSLDEDDENDPLNNRITEKEIHQHINKLKMKKNTWAGWYL